jgi:hypothetical protein
MVSLSGIVKELGNCNSNAVNKLSPAGGKQVLTQPCAIQDVRIIIDGHLKAITGKKGTYEVSGLALGKVNVRYSKIGYGSTEAEIEIKPPKTQHNVSLFKDTLDAYYWAPIPGQLKTGSTEFTPISAWNSVTDSDLSPKAKAAGAKAIGLSFAAHQTPDTLRQYESVTNEQLTSAEKWVNLRMKGETAQAGPAPALPTPILIDVAAWAARQDPAKNQALLGDFSDTYGVPAGAALRKKLQMNVSRPAATPNPEVRHAR